MLACFRGCNRNEDMLLKFLRVLEKYLFALDFYNHEIIDEIDIKLINFSEMVIKLNRGDIVVNGIIEKIQKNYELLICNPELAKNALSYYAKNGFYKRAIWLRYFLFEYEINLTKKSKSNIVKQDLCDIEEKGYESIEHIYPENSHYSYWISLFGEYDVKQKNSLKDSLGNFVLNSREKNSKLGNKPFPEKKSNKENPVGYKYGTYAEIEVSEYMDWDAKAILNRGLKLVDFLYERWGIKVGNGKKEDKKKFLGLDFL